MNNVKKVIWQVIFILVAFIFILLLSLGINFVFDEFLKVSFWVVVACKLVITMFIFNIVLFLFNRNELQDKNGLLYKTVVLNKQKIDIFYEQGDLYDKLEEAVKAENKKNLIAKYNEKLHKVTTRISYKDLVKDGEFLKIEEIEALCDKFFIKSNGGKFKRFLRKVFFVKTQRQKVFKVIEKIENGKYKIAEVTADELLKDKEIDRVPKNSLKWNPKEVAVKNNSIKAITFLITIIVTTAISFSLFVPNFWVELVKNLMILIGAVISGMMTGYFNSRAKIAVFDYRNKFFIQHLDIKNPS